MKHLTLLGSTGSIGCSTLDVVRHNPALYTVTALVAGKNVQRMVEQCLEFTPRYAVMDDEESARQLKAALQEKGSRTEVLSGQQAACEMAALDEVDQVMAAIVGAAGLLPTLAAIDAGKDVLLANKESLVTCLWRRLSSAEHVFCRSTASTTPFFRVYRNLFSRTWGTLTWSRMGLYRFCLPGLVARSVKRHCLN